MTLAIIGTIVGASIEVSGRADMVSGKAGWTLSETFASPFSLLLGL
jgi:hypothetical protein